ncbi:transcriptional regulator [Algimonas arctica]|uniref:Transcriptional regulator n=1 Tax=Algimonas arctica TaxID=1479486 RepID=A0A8J3CS16_9PROT|nr:helix-turn-helix transcriptional regulator [Algimonas arctica]GHB01436.1 transcriptional regulator [Algimonas arctica]
MSDVFKAMADETRRSLLDQLFDNNGQTLGQLTQSLDMSRQAVTKHLKILEAANLVSIHWQGREKLHFLNPVPLAEIVHRWVGRFEEAQLDMLVELKAQSESKDQSENRKKKQHGL